MLFSGLQKLSLLDFPTKTCCTVFTSGCNYRCPFCHNATLVLGEGDAVDEQQIFDLLAKRKGILDGVAVTGGEPLMHPELPDFLARVHEMGFLVKLDTNGTYPDRLKSIVERGLADYVAMDIKNCREKYALTAGVCNASVDKVEQSVAFLMSGAVNFEFRTTVVRGLHEREDFVRIGQWIKGDEKYFLQAFVDSGSLVGEVEGAFTAEQMTSFADAVRPFVPSVAIRGI